MTCECLYQVLGWMCKVVDSNFFQTVVLVITVVVTVHQYQKQVYQKEKDAASIILLQINSIHESVKKLSEKFIDSKNFDIASMWSATKVFDENYWEQNKHRLLQYLSVEKIEDINEYYTYATIINRQIQTFHDIIYATYEQFYLERKMMSKEQIESEKPHIRTFATHLDTLQSNCDEVMKLFSSFNMKSSSEILVEITRSNFKTWRKRKWQK